MIKPGGRRREFKSVFRLIVRKIGLAYILAIRGNQQRVVQLFTVGIVKMITAVVIIQPVKITHVGRIWCFQVLFPKELALVHGIKQQCGGSSVINRNFSLFRIDREKREFRIFSGTIPYCINLIQELAIHIVTKQAGGSIC